MRETWPYLIGGPMAGQSLPMTPPPAHLLYPDPEGAFDRTVMYAERAFIVVPRGRVVRALVWEMLNDDEGVVAFFREFADAALRTVAER